MNLISIIIGVLIIVALVFAIGKMNKGNSPCGGNCSTCVMSEHCEKQEQLTAAKQAAEIKQEQLAETKQAAEIKQEE